MCQSTITQSGISAQDTRVTYTTSNDSAVAGSDYTTTTGTATSYEHGALDTSSTEAEATETTGATGGGAAHTNLQPYITVRMWVRTA